MVTETLPFDGEGRTVTATYVPITDYKLAEDKDSIKLNADIATRTDGGKLRLWGLGLSERSNNIDKGAIEVTGYAGDQRLPTTLKINTARREITQEVENLIKALELLSEEQNAGGNSANTLADLQQQCDIGAIENLTTIPCAADQHRIAAHFRAGDLTVAVSSLVDYSTANFSLPDEELKKAACNITDVSLARHINVGGEGPQYCEHPNCSGGLRYDTGESLAIYRKNKGPPPSMSYGFDEISDVLRGAAGEDKFRVPKGYHTADKNEPPFMGGELNPSILYSMIHYNSLYSKYLGGPMMRGRETFHDLALTNGGHGGGSRMIYEYQNENRRLCFYASCPEQAGATNLIGPMIDDLQHLTLPQFHHTIGCGDVNSSTFARANLTNTRKWLQDNFGKKPNIPKDNPLFWLIAEAAFVNIAMRLRGLVKLHTQMTRLSHMTKNSSLFIDRQAGEAAIQTAEMLHNRPNVLGNVSRVRIRQLGMDIAMFDEETQKTRFAL